jgi:heptosyltransferase-3
MKGGRMLPLAKIKEVLLIQLGDIGDVVYTFPCARAIKETIPEAQVVLAVRKKAAGLVEGCRWVDGLVEVDTERRSILGNLQFQLKFWAGIRSYAFDMAVDLRRDSRSAILAFFSGAKIRVAPYYTQGKLWRNHLFTHLYNPLPKKNQYIVEHYMEPLVAYGFRISNVVPEIDVSTTKEEEISLLLGELDVPLGRPIFAIQPFSLWHYKEWGEENIISLIKKITRTYSLSVIVTGTKNEQERAASIVQQCGQNVFNFAGKTMLSQLPALYKKCKLFMGVDSAGIHIAAAVGTPTVSLYGPTPSVTWAPRGERHKVVQKTWPCVPCRQKGCDNSGKSRCLDELPVDEIWDVVNGQLQSS